MQALSQANAWLASDNAFGPGNERIFDFTLTFENTILSILPVACLGLIFPLHVWKYSRGPKVASAGPLYWARLITSLATVALEITRSVVWCRSRFPESSLSTLSSTSIASAVVGPLSACMFLAMMHVEYFHAIYSSSVIGAAISMVLLLDSARTRGFWVRSEVFAPVGQLSLAIVMLEIVFLVLQEVPKTLKDSVAGNKHFFKEAKAGFWSRMLVLWVNAFLFLGYRTRLTLANLGTLGPDFSTETLMSRFEAIWDKSDRTKTHALPWAVLKAFFWPFMAGALPRALFSLTNLVMPLAVQQILVYMGDETADPAYSGALVGAIAIGYFMNGLAFGIMTYYMNRLATYLRGVLVGLLFQKTLRLGLSEARAAASVGLMTADVEGIVQDMETIHDVTLMIPEVAAGMYLFYSVFGKAFFITFVVLLSSAALGWYAGNLNGPAYAKWNGGIQDRVAETITVIAQMKGIRMIGLDRIIARHLHALREREVELSRTARLLKVFFGIVRAVDEWLGYIMLLVGGLYWTIWRDGLDPVTVWPAIAYMRVVSWPFMGIFNLYPLITSLAACFARIQAFLNLPEQEDKREVLASISNEKQSGRAAIRFSGVSVEARDQSHKVLDEVNFDVLASTLSMVVGSVGSGKSVLLKTILGEAQASHGTVQLTTAKIAFCDQTAWLPDISIRDCIIGESDLDEARYAETIKACSLAYDIEQLPGGDATAVGSNGSSMSGGQKQRIALARAVYSLMPIVVCDDVLSALDAETAQAIFTDIFSATGILKCQGRTAVLATHSVQWLTSADQVLVLKEGKVSILEDEEEIVKYSETAVISAHDSYADEQEPEVIVDDQKMDLAFETAVQDTRGTDSGLYRFMFQAVTRWKMLLFILFTLIMCLTQSFQEIYIRIWLQVDAANKVYIFGMVAMLFYSAISDAFSLWIYQMVVMPTISVSLHSVFVEKVMSATLPFITSTPSGVLLNRFSQDMTLIGQQLSVAFFQAMYSGGLSLINLIIVASSASWAALCIPVVLLLLWVIQYFYLQTSRQVRLLDLEVKTPLYAKLNEMLSGVEHIRSFGWQSQTLKKSLQLVDDSQAPFYYMFTIQRWLYMILTMTGSGMSVVVAALALYLTKSTSQAGAGLGLIQNLHFTVSTVQFIQRWTKLETSLGAITRLKSFIEETPSESDEDRKPPPASWPAHGAVEFHNVSARYSSEPGAQTVIKNISLQIKAGEKVVIVGRTGSGKSTMILTLLNFLEMTGRITIDGVDISTIPRLQLRKSLTTLPQDSIEILGSVRDNLLPFERLEGLHEQGEDKITENSEKDQSGAKDRTAELEALLEKVHLLEVIKKKGGLDAAVKDLHLSSGQHQLFNLARAMLHRRDTGSKIVLMDEVTSHMDYETDKTMQAVLDSEFGECTRIVISHRTTGLASCDKLVTMQDGTIASVKTMKEKAEEKEKEIGPVKSED